MRYKKRTVYISKKFTCTQHPAMINAGSVKMRQNNANTNDAINYKSK